jgi:hypothetical protein
MRFCFCLLIEDEGGVVAYGHVFVVAFYVLCIMYNIPMTVNHQEQERRVCCLFWRRGLESAFVVYDAR